MPEIAGQLVLAQNQHAFIQDATKGQVQVYAGPHVQALSANDVPVTYDAAKDEYVKVDIKSAIRQNPFVPEGHYIVLTNPAFGKNNSGLVYPTKGCNTPADLEIGRKINVLGPATFPLWRDSPRRRCRGTTFAANQYLVVRIYNGEEATKNAVPFGARETTKFSNGQLVVIKGTEVPFFIPPTGFEVLTEDGKYVREALTLERLEYCILLDEDGEKRFERRAQRSCSPRRPRSSRPRKTTPREPPAASSRPSN